MSCRRSCLLGCCPASPPPAAWRRRSGRAGDDLAAAIAAAAPGDDAVLSAGIHAGPVTLDRALTLKGGPALSSTGGGEGSVVTVTAPGVAVARPHDPRLRPDREAMDSGVFLTKGATGALVEDNPSWTTCYGVHLQGSPDATVARQRHHRPHRPRSRSAATAS